MAYTYLWDAPYLDFSNEVVITYKEANTSDKPKPARFTLTDGNALLSFDTPGSYKVYAVDKGIRYERTVTVHKSTPSIEGSGLSAEDVERLKNDIALQVIDSIKKEPYEVPQPTIESVVQRVTEQVKSALKDEPYEVPQPTIDSVVQKVTEKVTASLKAEPVEVPQPTIDSVVQKVTEKVTEQVTAQVTEQVKTALKEEGGGGGTGPALVYNDDGTFTPQQ